MAENSRVYYMNLLQVSILNKTFIYDLDDNSEEILFVHDMDQLMDLDGIINIGTVLSTVEDDMGKHKKNTILTNEQATLYISEEEHIGSLKT